MLAKFTSLLSIVLLTVASAHAETHTVSFENKCGTGTPKLIQSGNTLSSGQPFTSNGPLVSAIAYLQTGNCGLNGERCITTEMTLQNPDPSKPGSGSSADLSLIPPLAFSKTTGFRYENGCDGQGRDCTSADCTTAFHKPSDTQVQVACQANNVNLVVTFCE
ncbi:glycopeptide [Phellopilus nigrolimitatus]|nr:glycopeptide [Phellopilus nigrolimitatus]